MRGARHAGCNKRTPDVARLIRLVCLPQACVSDFPILKSIFSIDDGAIGVGVQSALCLGEMQVKGPGLTIGCQQFPDIVHLLARLLGRFELLKRDQCRRQRFRDDPFVVAGNSLFGHDDPHPSPGQRSNFRPAL